MSIILKNAAATIDFEKRVASLILLDYQLITVQARHTENERNQTNGMTCCSKESHVAFQSER